MTLSLADGGVSAAKMADGAVTAAKIAAAQVTDAHLSPEAGISQSKISNEVRIIDADMVDGKHAADFLAVEHDYGRPGVAAELYEGAAKLSEKYVGRGQTNVVSTGMIQDQAVTSAKIASGQVVKSLNSLRDEVQLVAGENVTITSSGNALTISAAGGVGGNTLDQAYDQGGPGAGRTIVADAGPVNIEGPDGLRVNGLLGVGLTNPSAKLHVAGGNVFLENGYGLYWRDAGGSAYARLLQLSASNAVFVGNDMAAGGTYLLSGDDIRMVSGTSTLMYLQKGSGNVGIGTTTPAHKPDVAGTAQMTGFKMPTGAAAGRVLTSDASGVGTWQTPPTGLGGSGTANYLAKFAGENTLGNSLIYERGDNIGIGTTNPSDKLHVYASTGNALIIAQRAAASNGWCGLLFRGGNQNWDMYMATNSPDLNWKNDGGVRMTLNPSGNLGIGTMFPTQKLDVAGTVKMTGFMMPTDAAAGYVLTSDASGVGMWKAAPGGIGGSGAPNYVPKFTSNTELGTSALYESGGRVGIASTAPHTTLDVRGPILGQAAGANVSSFSDLNTGAVIGVSGLTIGALSGEGAVSGFMRSTNPFKAALYGHVSDNACGLTIVHLGSGKLMSLRTGSTEHFTVTNNGRVGIGMPDPAAQLHVAGGDIYIENNLNLCWRNAAGTAYPRILELNASDAVRVGNPLAVGGMAIQSRADIQLQSGTATLMQVKSNGNVGIGTTTPAQKLDVAGTVQMTRFKMPADAAAGRVLTSDASGVGTWQAPPTGLGGSGTANHLSKFTSSTTLGNSVIYENAGRVSVGTTDPGAAKLYVAGRVDVEHSEFNVSALKAQNANSGGIGLWGEGGGEGIHGQSTHIGVRGYSSVSSDGFGYGVLGIATSLEHWGYGVYGDSYAGDGVGVFGLARHGSGVNYDVRGKTNSPNGFGGYFEGKGYFSSKLGIGTANITNILTVQQGSATDPIADAWTTYSSKRWKTNINAIEGALAKVQRLRGVSFDWKADGKHDIGLVAEEVGEVVPEVVTYEDNGVDARSVDYGRLVAILIEALKEQQAQIEELKAKLSALTEAR